jgi:hypothetical protein
VETSGNVDKDGWSYAINFPVLQYPPPSVSLGVYAEGMLLDCSAYAEAANPSRAPDLGTCISDSLAFPLLVYRA